MTDTAGNIQDSSELATPVITHVVLDRIPPTVSISASPDPADSWTNKAVTVTINATDTPQSNLLKAQYKINNGAWTDYIGPFPAPQGNNVISAQGIDKAGNVSAVATKTIKVDQTKPSVTVTRPEGDTFRADTSNHYRFGGLATDNGELSWAGIYFDGQLIYQSDQLFDMTYVMDTTSVNENVAHTIGVRARDAAGNENYTEKTAWLVRQAEIMSNWYFAEGTTNSGFDEYLTVQNIDQNNTANLTFDFQINGQVITKTGTVPPHARGTFNVRDLLGMNNVECAVNVHSSGALVIVERPMYFDYRGWTGGTDTLGANTPGNDFYFAEGTTRNNANDGQFDTYLVLANFGDSAATANVTYMLGTGQNVARSYNVPAHGRNTVYVNNEIGNNQDVSMQVSATGNIVAERSMYFNHAGRTGGSVVIGTDSPSATWYFAEGCTQPGFEEYLTLLNANSTEANVTFDFMPETGKNITANVTVPAKSRATYRINTWVPANQDVSTEVASNVPVVAERPMYFLYHGAWDGGDDNIGIKQLSNEWYLAEGTTRPGFEEWITIQNPSMNSCGITVDYFLADGTVDDCLFTVAPYSRLTINANSTDPKVGVGPGKDVSCHIKADVPVAVERPMYFSYGSGGWTGGHIGSGYPNLSD